jgi:hypothetical protein
MELSEFATKEFAKAKILDLFEAKAPTKTKLYLDDLRKALPELKANDVRKIANEMVQEGKLAFWSSGSTTLYTLSKPE